MHKGKSLLVLGVVLAIVLSGPFAFAGAEKDYDIAKDKLTEFKKSKKLHKYRDKWLKQIGRFDRIVKKHPKHKRACDSRYNIGVLYRDLSEISYSKSDRRASAEYFESISAKCSGSSLADDGLYWSAVMYVRLRDKTRARAVLKRSLKLHPKGDMRGKTADLLKELDDGKAAKERKAPAAAAAGTLGKAGVGKADKVIRPSHDPALMYNMEVESLDDKTKLKLSFYRLVPLTYGEIGPENGLPRRLFFDFSGCKLAKDIKPEWKIGDGRVIRIRIGQYKDEIIRVVFDVTRKAGIFSLENTIEPPGTIISINGKAGASAYSRAAAKSKGEKQSAAPTGEKGGGGSEGIESIISQKSKSSPDKEGGNKKRGEKKKAAALNAASGSDDYQVRLVVIDPGHGGADSGAKGRKNTLEKDVVLQVSKRLKRILEKEQKIKVVLARTDDTYLELFDRTKVANDLGADLFISIHCNAHRKRETRGIETWYLNNSADKYSRRLANRENTQLGKPISDLEYILTDLSMNANVADSVMLANMIQKGMVKKLKRKYSNVVDRGVNRALFHVLLYARMPAVLVETSFISNPDEEKRLKNSKYQETLAKGIAEGIEAYSNKMRKLAKHN